MPFFIIIVEMKLGDLQMTLWTVSCKADPAGMDIIHITFMNLMPLGVLNLQEVVNIGIFHFAEGSVPLVAIYDIFLPEIML